MEDCFKTKKIKKEGLIATFYLTIQTFFLTILSISHIVMSQFFFLAISCHIKSELWDKKSQLTLFLIPLQKQNKKKTELWDVNSWFISYNPDFFLKIVYIKFISHIFFRIFLKCQNRVMKLPFLSFILWQKQKKKQLQDVRILRKRSKFWVYVSKFFSEW